MSQGRNDLWIVAEVFELAPLVLWVTRWLTCMCCKTTSLSALPPHANSRAVLSVFTARARPTGERGRGDGVLSLFVFYFQVIECLCFIVTTWGLTFMGSYQSVKMAQNAVWCSAALAHGGKQMTENDEMLFLSFFCLFFFRFSPSWGDFFCPFLFFYFYIVFFFFIPLYAVLCAGNLMKIFIRFRDHSCCRHVWKI